jgi:ribose-phosphate pyrophosphokinase
MDELKVFSGTGHPSLAKAVCEYLGISLGEAEVFEFSNENIFVRILENVRERDVFVIQPLSSPVNKNLVELLIMARTDKKDQPRVPITARLIADLLTAAGANRVLTVDLHAAQIQGFFNIPVDELTALYILTNYWKEKAIHNLVVVATDIGISARARDVAAKLNAPLAIIEKRRIGNADATETLNIIGEVQGMCALTIDDEIDTAGSLVSVVNTLLEHGATEVYSCCTHPVFSGPAIERISKAPVIEVVVTDTIPVGGDKMLGKITVLPMASLLGEAIHRIHTGLSIGAMFE